jgi:nitroreductase
VTASIGGASARAALDVIATTRSIRRYLDRPVEPAVLSEILFAASRAPSGSNRQLARFLILGATPEAREARLLIAGNARATWAAKAERDAYDLGAAASPKERLARTMREYVEGLADVPVLLLACLIRPGAPASDEGASVYPACQNLLLAARALGLGGVLTRWHRGVELQLADLLGIPAGVAIHATISLGYPAGRHGPVRRIPLRDAVFEGRWGRPAEWISEPAGTRHAGSGQTSG